MNPRIYLLAFGTFTVGTEGYVIAGVLPAVAHDMSASLSLTGQLVTVFALVYALAGPPLIGVFRRVPPKTLLISAAAAFAASNLLAALAPDFAVLTAARVLAALSAALFAAPAAATAAALCEPDDLPHAIAVTASGNALALTLGAPIGTLVGSALGWRGAFYFVTALAVIAAIGVRVGLPDVPVVSGAAGRVNLLRMSAIRWGLITTFGVFLAAYCVYTYLSPIVERSTGMGSTGVAALMIVFGAGGLFGGRTVGASLVRFPMARILTVVLTTMATLLAVLALLTALDITSIATVVAFPLLFALGGAWWSGGIAQQTRIAGHAPDQRSQALGLHFSAQFLGVAVGGVVGGLALSGAGPVAVPVVSAIVAAATLFSIRLTVTPSAVTAAPASMR